MGSAECPSYFEELKLQKMLLLEQEIELMLTRCAKAYRSSCLQTVSLSPAISSQFILGVCTVAEDHKKSIKPLFLEVQDLSKSSMVIRVVKRSSDLQTSNPKFEFVFVFQPFDIRIQASLIRHRRFCLESLVLLLSWCIV